MSEGTTADEKSPEVTENFEEQVSKFHDAAKHGNVTIARSILAASVVASPSEGEKQHSEGDSWLPEPVQRFLRFFEHRDETDYGRTAFLQASRHGHLDFVRFLVEEGADISVKETGGCEDGAVHLAALDSHYGVVEFLTEIRPELADARNKDGETPLLKAAYGGSHDIAEFLINSKRADIEARGKSGRTPLIVASYQGHVKLVELLVEKNANVLAKDNGDFESMAIHYACDRGRLDVVAYLLSVKPGLTEAKDKFGDRPICRAAANGQTQIVEYLVETMHCNPDVKGHLNRTPLFQAAIKGHMAVVNYLARKANCNIFTRDDSESMAIHVAADNGYFEIVTFFLDLEPRLTEVKDKNGETPIWRALNAVQLKVIECLIDKKANIETRNGVNWTPLIAAAVQGRLQIVEILVKKGADLFARDMSAFKSMAIHLAAFYGHCGVVACLLESKPELINAREIDGETPLFRAAFGGRLNVVTYLVEEKKASIDVTNDGGRSALSIAAKEGHQQVVQYLISKGANIMLRDNKEALAIHLAAYYGHISIIEFLLDANPAMLEEKDNNGRTPLATALMNDKDDVVLFLEKRGAVKKTWLSALFGV